MTRARRGVAGALLLLLPLPSLAPAARATSVPDGFLHEQIVGEPFVTPPVGFDFLPDGRIVLVELASGIVRVAPAGAAASDSIATIPDVNANHPERGLLGVAADPAWPARPYLYFHYTATDSSVHVQMWEAQGDLVDPASSSLMLTRPFLLLGGIPDLAGIHNAGTLRFAPDGTLWVSTGDDGQSCEAQDLDVPLGKLLRLDVSGMPRAGSGPPPPADLAAPGNPFTGPGWPALVAAWGLRNPFRFDVDPWTGDVWIGNVGSSLYEEIDRLPADSLGLNFGWPQFEGPVPVGCCGACGVGNVFTFPVHAFPHPPSVVSVIGGPVLRHCGLAPGAFPPQYRGDYFYAEIFSGRIVRLTRTAAGWDLAPGVDGQPAPDAWAAGFVGATQLREGPDGALWIASLGLSASLPRGLHRIRSARAGTGAPRAGFHAATLNLDPNPAREGELVTLSLETTDAHPVTLEIFDTAGRLVRRLLAPPGPGRRAVTWDGRDRRGRRAGAGLYFVRMESGGNPVTAKLALLR